MANPEHLAILKQGVAEWNGWRKRHPEVAVNLRGASLRFENLDCADFRNGDMDGANFAHADLRDANFSEANLEYADLSWADLTGASLRHAYLGGAMLTQASVSEADFTRTKVCGTYFASLDLSEAKGLESVVHRYGSTVGIDTVYMSRGQIPEVFLRGCGVPDEFIEFVHSIGKNPIEFYSCFISYSSKDQAFADRLYADLQAKGVRCWFAPHDIVGGRKIHEPGRGDTAA